MSERNKEPNFINKYRQFIVAGLIIFLVILSIGGGYYYGEIKLCDSSGGVMVKHPETNKKVCIVTDLVQKDFCIDDRGISYNSEGFN